MTTSQVRSNHAIYVEKLRDELEREHLGKSALMHDGEVVLILDSEDDAYAVGRKWYGLGEFSIEEIGAEPVHLGTVMSLTD